MKFATTLLRSAIALWLLPGCVAQDVSSDLPATELIPCDQVADALGRAQPGETVAVDACTVAGTITVPAGVTLQGAGIDKTIIEGRPGAAAVVLTPNAKPEAPTTLRGVSIASDGTAGVVAIGAGEAAIDDVKIGATRGIGVGAEDVTTFTVSNVTLAGNDGMHIADETTPDMAATHGLVLVRVATATLQGTSVSSFAGYGAVFIDSVTTWTGGGASDNDGAGIMAIGGEAQLTDLEVCRTQRGNRTVPAYGAIFTSSAVATGAPMPGKPGTSVIASGLSVCDNEGIGLLYDHGTALDLHGMSSFAGNEFAGLLVTDSSGITVEDVSVSGTKVGMQLPIGDQGMLIDGGDGVQIIRSTEMISFSGVSTNMNERGGLLIDTDIVEPGQAGFLWSDVDVGMNMEFGAVCQWGSVVAAPNAAQSPWDTGIVRDAGTEALDTSFTSPLDVVGVIDPNVIPAPGELVGSGLSGIGVR